MNTFSPDPKPESRHVADREQWDRIVFAKAGPCRGCGAPGESFHHLVPRSLRGDDVEANVIPLCGHGTRGCHGALENHTGGWEEVAHAVRHSLTPLEVAYVKTKKSKAWLERYYPAGGSLCARCKRPLSASEKPQEGLSEPRKRKRWQMSIPDDAEDGAEVMDGLIEACRLRLKESLGHDGDVPPYYVVVPVLADWLSE